MKRLTSPKRERGVDRNPSLALRASPRSQALLLSFVGTLYTMSSAFANRKPMTIACSCRRPRHSTFTPGSPSPLRPGIPQPTDPPHRLPQRRRLQRQRLPGPELTPQDLPFLRAHGRLTRRLRLLPRQVRQMQQPRRCHRVQRQRTPQPFRRLQLQFLQPAAALEREVITLDPPTVGVPAHQPLGVREARRSAASSAAATATA